MTMKKSHLLYGAREKSVSELTTTLTHLLKMEFDEHDSAFRGGPYSRYEAGSGESVIVQRNLELDEEIAERDFADFDVLVYVDKTMRPNFWKDKLKSICSDISLLREETFVSDTLLDRHALGD